MFCLPEGAHNRGLPSNPTIYTTSPSLDEDRSLVWLMVVHFTCPMISSIPHCCTVSTFHQPCTICFKNGTFSLHFSRESRMEIQSRRFFLLNLRGTQTSKRLINMTKLVQMIFNTCYGYFEYVSYLPRGITLIVLN